VPQASQTDRSVHFGVFDLDLQSGELRKQGAKIRLPHQSFQILARLLQRPGEVVTRQELRQLLWPGDTFVDFDVGLSSAVKKLRDALGDSADNARFVETLPRRGYRFIGAISTPRELTIAERPRWFRRSRAATTAVVLLMAFAGLAVVSVEMRRRIVAAPAPPIRSVAVLPLANLTGDPAQEYFADGMTDALITELAQISNVRVISRTSVMPYKEARKSAPAVGHELNVDAIVEGTVVRSGTRVRIDAQLVDTRNDRHVWAKGYERGGDDIVALQGDVARAIAEAIAGKLIPEQARPTSHQVSQEANDFFFKGVTAAGRRGYQGFKEAISYAEAAIARQPDFSAAYAAIALWNVQFSFVGPLSPSEFMPRAEAAARKALELDDRSSKAHAVLGMVLYRFHWDWQGAETQLRRALELNASYAEGHRMLAMFLSASGRTSEAVSEARRARELDPLSDQALLSLGVTYREAGQNEQAIAAFRKVLEDHPDLGQAHFDLGVSYVTQRDFDAGIRELRTAVTLSRRNPRFLADLGYAYAVMGNRTEAHKILSELDAVSRRQYVTPVEIAGIQAALGERETALASLEKACELQDPFLSRLMADGKFGALHSDSRFQALVRRIGLMP
jgi:TolB-like protein/DNA-binding winged helix-turn-helix (wHTH) protein/tetratricopeptide (TPR) repeat protein